MYSQQTENLNSAFVESRLHLFHVVLTVDSEFEECCTDSWLCITYNVPLTLVFGQMWRVRRTWADISDSQTKSYILGNWCNLGFSRDCKAPKAFIGSTVRRWGLSSQAVASAAPASLTLTHQLEQKPLSQDSWIAFIWRSISGWF